MTDATNKPELDLLTKAEMELLEQDQRRFISDISNAIDLVLDARLSDDYAIENIETLSNEVIHSVLKVVDGSDEAPGWHVIRDRGELYLSAQSISGNLAFLFDEINS